MSPKAVRKKLKKQDTGQQSYVNANYYSPLQTQLSKEEDENTDKNDIDCEQIITKNKVYIPPITVLKCSVEQLHNFCKSINCSKYSIKKMSIGIKLFCMDIKDYESACASLKGKFEFFSYADKNVKPYKVLLFGLDEMDPSSLKTDIIGLGLQCLDVKRVKRTRPNNSVVIFYVIYFTKKSVSLNELRKSYSVINYVKVKWEYQRRNSNQITQCYNCQMFGHGSSQCAVKSYCSICQETTKLLNARKELLSNVPIVMARTNLTTPAALAG